MTMDEANYGPTLLKIENVNLSYGSKVVLRDVNAEVKEILRNCSKGQVTAFLGPSGIGKTQLFRIIAGLQRPTSGRVLLNSTGEPVTAGAVGVIDQDCTVFPWRTVYSNLMLAANRKDPKTATDRVLSYLDTFDLTDRAEAYPTQLSGGQKQRCAILQQILCSSHFLLMDEPFSRLDLLMLEKTAALIQKIANLDELNTIILTTHDITAAASVADHLWLIGRERDASGALIPGARIVETYDMVARGLCWHPEIITTYEFVTFVADVKKRFRSL